jgi:TRAP-type C4-dicarboxylate transport system substrate-binding protein
MRRRDVLRGTAFLAGTLAIGRAAQGPALAEAQNTLKASDVHPPGYPTVVAVENFGKKLEQATNGRLGVQMYASMQLGGEKEAIEQAPAPSARSSTISTCSICRFCSATPRTCRR